MELQDFVAETLKQIIDGVIAAQTYAAEKGARVNPPIDFRSNEGGLLMWEKGFNQPIHSVDFDVAVTAKEGTKTQGGISVLVGALGLKATGQSEESAHKLNRIRFSIPIGLPIKRG